MSENTTPQMGSPEKEPLLKSEGTDQTSAEELLDQISAKTDGFCVADAVAERAEHAGLRICERQRADAGHAVACENAETVYPCLVRAGRDLHGMRFITPLDAELDRAALSRFERGLKLGIR